MQTEQKRKVPEVIASKSSLKIAYSLCIPRVSVNVTHKDIYNVFNKLQIGEIHRVDLIERQTTNNDKFKRIFIHFKSWADNETANQMKTRFDSGKDVKIVYDDPWYWKLSVNKSAATRCY